MIRFRSVAGRAHQMYLSLKRRYPVDFSLDPGRAIEIGGHATLALMNGSRQVSLDHALVDQWSAEVRRGASASILVRIGDDFVRVATNIKTATGARAVGTMQDRSHPAYGLTLAGHSFTGYTVVVGRKYIVTYHPILDAGGRVIGAFAVGFDIHDIRVLSLAEKFGVGVACGAGAVLVARDFAAAALASAPAPGAAQWLISLGIAALLGFGVYAAMERFASRSLREAADAARRLASGDLSKQLPVNRGDEIGIIIDAQNSIGAGLAALIGRVRETADSLATAAGEIAAGNADLSARTEAQAGSLEQTAAAMNQFTSTVRNNAENAREAHASAHASAQATSRRADDGASLMGRAVGTMGEIREASRRMSDIVGTIEGIAFQTNILALNAAVEAARAGAEGRGFAVVAQEVRVLAQRSAEAAREIKDLIGEAVGKIDTGGELIDEAGRNVSGIVESIQDVTRLMAEINRASNEQSAGIEEVNRAVGHMDEMTQQNAALVEEAAAASASMRQQTGLLENSVKAFKLAAG